MRKPKIGLLPLYIELYDKVLPQLRGRMERYLETLAGEFEKRGVSVLPAPVCRLKEEFEAALRSFEQGGADAVVTLHLAYSPSMESINALAGTFLPVIVLDTTETWSFGPGQSDDEIMYNHGIHGVQDMCSLMKRNGKRFDIAAGHWQRSDVLDRVTSLARAACVVSCMRHARVGVIGGAFEGMGDFRVSEKELRESIGIETVCLNDADAEELPNGVSDVEIEAEMRLDRERYAVRIQDEAAWKLATKTGLALRKWAKRESLTAFSVNFQKTMLPCMPFLEASKAMARGMGYAGEGDTLTASLVGALLGAYPETSFTEMFCPDWQGGSVFLSHMGEMNLDLARDIPLLTDTESQFVGNCTAVAAYGCFKPGDAAIVNLAPDREGFTLIVAQGEMQNPGGADGMAAHIRGWFRPVLKLPEFLEEFSLAGGTHHSALVYGDAAREIASFGKMMGWKVIEL